MLALLKISLMLMVIGFIIVAICLLANHITKFLEVSSIPMIDSILFIGSMLFCIGLLLVTIFFALYIVKYLIALILAL